MSKVSKWTESILYDNFLLHRIKEMKLQEPRFKGIISVEEAIRFRRTIRSFKNKDLSIDKVSQLLWSAYGMTEGFRRTVPSAGALYPMDVYVVIGLVGDMDKGVYYYVPEAHEIYLISKGDLRKEIAKASLSQMWMAEAPVSFITCIPVNSNEAGV